MATNIFTFANDGGAIHLRQAQPDGSRQSQIACRQSEMLESGFAFRTIGVCSNLRESFWRPFF
jgi:hypothetical protein